MTILRSHNLDHESCSFTKIGPGQSSISSSQYLENKNISSSMYVTILVFKENVFYASTFEFMITLFFLLGNTLTIHLLFYYVFLKLIQHVVYHMTHACVYMCVLSNSPSKYARKHLVGIMKKMEILYGWNCKIKIYRTSLTLPRVSSLESLFLFNCSINK